MKTNKIRHSRESGNPAATWVPTFAGMTALLMLAACSPTVKVEAPDKPIEINLNVNIEQHVKVEIQKDVQKAIANNNDIF